MSDGLTIAMVLNGLPDSFKPLAVHVTQNEDNVTFTDFKRRLQIYEESEKTNTVESADNVMKTSVRPSRGPAKTHSCSGKSEDTHVTCYRCGMQGHKSRACPIKVWCAYCKSNTHQESICRKKRTQDGAKSVAEEPNSDQDHLFKVNHTKRKKPPDNVNMKGIMVDGGATSHIVNDIEKFESFVDSFRPESHSVELADRSKCSGKAQRRGTAVIYLLDHAGRQHVRADALYIPSYPHNIFSVARAINRGATITFKKEDNHMVTKDGSRFDIHKSQILFYLPTVEINVDQCKQCVCHDVQTWHEILVHCIYEDVQQLQGIVEGMEIKGGAVRPAFCEVCTQGKFTQTRNREPDSKAKKPLELLHTDLAGPMRTPSIDGHKYTVFYRRLLRYHIGIF